MIGPYAKSCCDGSGTAPGTAPQFAQARLIADNTLHNVWLPTDRIPTRPPDFKFYNPETHSCYKIVAGDPVSTTPGHVITSWNSVMDSSLYTAYCTSGATYAEARTCAGSLMSLWKNLTGLTLPYNFKSSGGVCGLIDGSSPTSSTPGSLLTGETITTGCGDALCTMTPITCGAGGAPLTRTVNISNAPRPCCDGDVTLTRNTSCDYETTVPDGLCGEGVLHGMILKWGDGTAGNPGPWTIEDVTAGGAVPCFVVGPQALTGGVEGNPVGAHATLSDGTIILVTA